MSRPIPFPTRPGTCAPAARRPTPNARRVRAMAEADYRELEELERLERELLAGLVALQPRLLELRTFYERRPVHSGSEMRFRGVRFRVI